MKLRSTLVHIAVAAAIGGLVTAFTPARWAAVSLWVSAAMLANGAVATVEDASPGGFDNPDGSSTKSEAGSMAFKLAAMALGLVCLGVAIQFA
jgi:hypothetical protein